jgi:hypothetical protein
MVFAVRACVAAVLVMVIATTNAAIALGFDGRLLVSPCEFMFGFKTLHDLIPEVVGECQSDEFHNPANGDGQQRTTNGLLVWRKADNWTAFTDGTTTWINGPMGLQSRAIDARFDWEAAATAPEPPPVSLPPGSDALVQQAITDAAGRTGVDPSTVTLVAIEAREWSDASLGCPKPGQFYAQVITPGFLILVEAAGQRFEYHTDLGRRVELC